MSFCLFVFVLFFEWRQWRRMYKNKVKCQSQRACRISRFPWCLVSSGAITRHMCRAIGRTKKKNSVTKNGVKCSRRFKGNCISLLFIPIFPNLWIKHVLRRLFALTMGATSKSCTILHKSLSLPPPAPHIPRSFLHAVSWKFNWGFEIKKDETKLNRKLGPFVFCTLLATAYCLCQNNGWYNALIITVQEFNKDVQSGKRNITSHCNLRRLSVQFTETRDCTWIGNDDASPMNRSRVYYFS